MSILDRQDDEDDFTGADEGSRSEIADVGVQIHRALQGHTCLVLKQVEVEHTKDLRALLQAESRQIAHYTHTPDINEEMATECCSYLLLLSNRNGRYDIDYNWATHASNYWIDKNIRYTDWDMTSSPEIIEYLAAVVREVNIEEGRIWSSNLAWQQMRNLRKLRVIEPTCPWETGKMDDFSDMIKLELLDLSRNRTMHVLPSLSDATNLKTLILDGCVGLEHVGPHGLPEALESFSFDAGSSENNNEAKISKISLIGCKNLDKFTFEKVVQLPRLEQLVLLGCKQLCAIVWWEERELKKLWIDTHGEEERELPPCSGSSSAISIIHYENYNGYAVLRDVRLVQSLVINRGHDYDPVISNLYLNLCKPGSRSEPQGPRVGSMAVTGLCNEHLVRYGPTISNPW
uniref:NB-ARC domain-containing protein n=1 Tax=Setaria viridis TaxID=4556 RepID=A0A4U6VX69_SETVI|nr:hypothetical protein SEVIR_2G178600v2 [Setaria viridis]